MKVVGMIMNDVELLGSSRDTIEHDQMVDQRIEHARIKTQSLRADRFQWCTRFGISARKQGHIVATANEFFGQVGDDLFGSAVEARRTSLVQRCNLRYLH